MIGYHQGYQDSGITGPTGLGGLKDVLEKDAPGEATAPQDNGKEMDEVEAPKGKNFESTFTLYNIKPQAQFSGQIKCNFTVVRIGIFW